MAEEGQVIGCHSVAQWEEHFKRGEETKKLVVVDFTASWCPPCRLIAPVLAEYAKRYPHAIFLKVDIDELKTVATEYAIEAMPTFVFLKDGKEVERFVGADKDGLLALIEKHATAVATA